MNKTSHKDPNLTRTVGKALKILDCMTDEEGSFSTSDLARRCAISRPTAYRLLSTLMHYGYVRQDTNADDKYTLGYKILKLASIQLERLELRPQAHSFLKGLSDETNETAHLAVLDGDAVVYIEKVESKQAVRMHSLVGNRNPLHCTALGKAVLAYLPADEQRRMLSMIPLKKRTPHTITKRSELQKHLRQVCQQGFAIDDMENEEGIRCVGAPILDHTGKPIAAISVSGPAYRLDLNRLYDLGSRVRDSAAAISREIGYGS